MKTILYFDMAKVAKLISHAETSTERRGMIEEFHYANYESMSEVPPGLLWAKDGGIYLLSNGKLPEGESYESLGLIAYAVGFDPNRDAGVWQKQQDAVGGDDFVEFIELEGAMRAIEGRKEGYFAIEVTETHYSYFWVPRM